MIAVVYPQFYGVGGIARYLASFLENLPPDAPKVYLITGDQDAQQCQFRGVEIIHIPLNEGRLSLVQWGLAARRVVKRLHDAGEISVINYHCPPLIPCLFMPAGIDIVLTPHSTYRGLSGRLGASKYFKSPWNPVSVQIKIWMEYCILAKAKEVVCLTEKAYSELATYGYTRPIHIVPNGVDISAFASKGKIAKEYDVVFVGRIEIPKGSRPMVDVCRQLIAAQPDIRIAIIGYGDDEPYVRESLADCAKNIHFTGKILFSQVADYLERSKVYLSTSYYEGLPGTCLEAMSMELPVVVWDMPFYKGLVADGVSGVVVAVDQSEEFVNKVLALLSDANLRGSMGAAGRRQLVENYNWEKLAKRLVDIFIGARARQIKNEG